MEEAQARCAASHGLPAGEAFASLGLTVDAEAPSRLSGEEISKRARFLGSPTLPPSKEAAPRTSLAIPRSMAWSSSATSCPAKSWSQRSSWSWLT